MLRREVDQWRSWPNPNDWRVTPETARLLQHWRHHRYNNIRPFFCQVEAVDTVIWLTEVINQALLGYTRLRGAFLLMHYHRFILYGAFFTQRSSI